VHKFTVHGARGSMPACGADFARFGGHTTCFSIETEKGILIIDAGTGISTLGRDLAHRPRPPAVTIIFTHLHLDHSMGLPSFLSLQRSGTAVCLKAPPQLGPELKECLSTLVGPPFWPTDLHHIPATVRLEDLNAHRHPVDLYGCSVTWCRVRHPEMCFAYRLETPHQVVVVMTDHEPGDREIDERLLEFCRGADVLLYDAQYTPMEHPAHSGWGHGTWCHAVDMARQAGVGRLILTHHHPDRTDSQIDAIVAAAREVFPATSAAADGTSIDA